MQQLFSAVHANWLLVLLDNGVLFRVVPVFVDQAEPHWSTRYHFSVEYRGAIDLVPPYLYGSLCFQTVKYILLLPRLPRCRLSQFVLLTPPMPLNPTKHPIMVESL